MAKRDVNPGFSLRRLIFQRTRTNDNNSSFRLRMSDIEEGKTNTTNKAQIDTRNNCTVDQTPASIAEVTSHDGTNGDICVICYLKESADNTFFSLDLCRHKFCVSCLEKYLKNEINESRTDIACPQCSMTFHPNDIEYLLKNDPDYTCKYEEFMIRRYLVTDPDSRWCPAPNCNFAVIATGCASCPQLKCERPKCGVSFCYHCKAEWHPDQTCDTARKTRHNVLRPPSLSYAFDPTRRDDVKSCPRCQVLIVKMNDGSCNHMVCSVCGAEFCWLCMKEVSDLHYLSPSGCTFWGKKPWSRKKKIVWQIGTLVGAPVGIALLAGIAIPSMVIGIPVWVGRKLLERYKTRAKHKRNVSVTVGVIASILISPVLAGLAIALGVPILLFYVYGVVPVSLCRAGCASSKDEINLDAKISDETHINNSSDIGSIDAKSRLGATSIGDVSLSATSESINDCANISTVFRNQKFDRESTIALAGSIKNQNIEYVDEVSRSNTSENSSNVVQNLFS